MPFVRPYGALQSPRQRGDLLQCAVFIILSRNENDSMSLARQVQSYPRVWNVTKSVPCSRFLTDRTRQGVGAQFGCQPTKSRCEKSSCPLATHLVLLKLRVRAIPASPRWALPRELSTRRLMRSASWRAVRQEKDALPRLVSGALEVRRQDIDLDDGLIYLPALRHGAFAV